MSGKDKIVDEFTKTQPTLELLLLEIRGIASGLQDIRNHLSRHDEQLATISAQTRLAGNIAGAASDTANEALEVNKQTLAIVRRIDQTLLGVNELAKSGFDIATALRSVKENKFYDDPIVEFENFNIVGTGN